MRITLIALLMVVAAACAPLDATPFPPVSTSAAEAVGLPTATALTQTVDQASNPSTTATIIPETSSLPGWLTMPLVDVRSGQSLTLSDFQGKSVLVRAIAEWCSNCRAGQSAWRDQVLPQVDANSVVLVTLDVETNNSAESLAAYANNNSFPWIFAIMTPALQTELVAQFGNSVLVPPAEPQWVIRPDGSFTGLLTDRSPQTLIGLLAATGT